MKTEIYSYIYSYIDKRNLDQIYYVVGGISYNQGRRLQRAGWIWCRKFDGNEGFWFHRDEKIAIPALKRLELSCGVIPKKLL